MTAQEHQYRDSIIRRASSSDIGSLVKICRTGFPQSIRWQSFQFLARKWWETAVASAGAETWVVEVDGEVLAFCLLVTNEAQWIRETRQRCGSSFWLLIAAVLCPVLTVAKVMTMMTSKTGSYETKQPALQGCKREMRTWVEPIVVGTRHRRRGLAKSLLRHCEARTKALSKKAVFLRVDKSNRAARSFYEAMGYQETSVNRMKIIYSKLISSSYCGAR
jgi:GNAT superfamily N-acetyltransferase